MVRVARGGGTRLAMAVAMPARRPQEAVLREVLLRDEGWETAPGAPVPVRGKRRQYLLTPLAWGHGWRVYLCEAPRHPGLPEYLDRRHLHRRIAAEGGRALTVFSDAAGTRQVWSWMQERPFGVAAYTEEYRSAGVGGEAGASRVPEVEREPGCDDPGAAHAGAEAALRVLTGRLRRSPALRRLLGSGADLSDGERLQRLIEGSRTPDIPRRVWAELGGLRILDPACGSGSWLVGCLLGLGAIAGACLQRMLPWVEDTLPVRADRHVDFRRLTERSRELARGGVRDRLALEMVLLRCVRGVEENPAAATRCRRALAAHLSGGDASPEAEALVDVRWGRVATEARSASELAERARREPAIAAVAAAVRSEAEALARAEEQLIRMRLRGAIAEGDLGEGRHEIQRRRRLISGLLSDGTAGEERPALLPWIEYLGIERAGGFHLVRGEPSGPPGNTPDVPAG